MPDIENFTNSENYYSTIFHELSHWSSYPQRLDRIKNISKYDYIYAMEELIAELSSAFLCSEKGISMDTTQHSEYLGSWVKSLKANSLISFCNLFGLIKKVISQ